MTCLHFACSPIVLSKGDIMPAHVTPHDLILSALCALAPVLSACAVGADVSAGRTNESYGLEGGSSSTSTGGDGESGNTDGGADTSDDGELAKQTRNILIEHCAECHDGGAKAGGIDSITDLKWLLDSDAVIPGDPDASLLIHRITSEGTPMPPSGAGDPLSVEEIELISNWILKAAPPPPNCEENEFISLDAMAELMLVDLFNEVDKDDRRFTRYLTVVHLHNAGFCPEDIDIFRAAAVKLINSLSREDDVRQPLWIDGDELILRIDLRDYAWDDNPTLTAKGFEDTWEALVVQNPFAVEYEGGDMALLKELTTTPTPFQSVDSVLYIATRGELYYDILELPTDVAELEASLDLPSLDDPDLNEGEIVRAAFRKSGVSNANRMIERSDINLSGGRAYWRSFDVGSNAGFGDIFVDPLGFQPDGGEVIFNLENGFQGYMLVDAEGIRINEAPVQVVQDPVQRDGIVKNGISCMFCHSGGIIPKPDDLLPFFEANKSKYSLEERDLIELLFLDNDEQAEIQKTDAKAFAFAMSLAGLDVGDTEPIYATYDHFETSLDLRRTASELAVTAAHLDQQLSALAFELQTLRYEMVSREVLAEQYLDALCKLLPMPGTDVAPVCPVAQ